MRLTAVLAVAALLGVSGCDRASHATFAPTGPGGSQAKLNGYTTGFNTPLSSFGLPEEYTQYVQQDFAHKTVSDDNLFIGAGWLDQARGELKAARALPGGLGGLDTEADKVIVDLDKILARLSGLKAYYDSKGYREDGFVRGHREDPQMIAEFKAGLADMQTFNRLLTAERDKRAQAELTMLRLRGDKLGYDSKLAMRQSEGLITLFKSPGDVTNPAILSQADAQVAKIEQTLTDQRLQLNHAKQTEHGADQWRDQSYGFVSDHLNSMIGDYRQMKSSGKPDDFNAAVNEYNQAISSANALVH